MTPKRYRLLRDLPDVKAGVVFEKSAKGNIYFLGIPISCTIPEDDQVGIHKFEAKYVENNPEWFEPVKE